MDDVSDWRAEMEAYQGDSIHWRNFGLEVKAARSFLGMTKQALGNATDLTPATVARIEKGEGSGTPRRASCAIQAYLESRGIEFPEGTATACIALRVDRGARVQQVAAALIDRTMPVGLRQTFQANSP